MANLTLSRTQIVKNNHGTFILRGANSPLREGEELVCKVNKPYNPFMVRAVMMLNGPRV